MTFSPWAFGPLAFFVFFVAMWLAVTGVLSLFGGWSHLAKDFRADGSLIGERFHFVSGSMGNGALPVNYGNCLTVTVGDEGIGLAVFFPFRFRSPSLFVPWNMIESVERKRFLFISYAQIRIRDHWPILSIYGRAGRHILERYEQRFSSGLKPARWQIGDRRPT